MQETYQCRWDACTTISTRSVLFTIVVRVSHLHSIFVKLLRMGVV